MTARNFEESSPFNMWAVYDRPYIGESHCLTPNRTVVLWRRFDFQ
jgi:hypothetical protein